MRAIRDYLPAAGVFVLAIALWEAVVYAFAIEFYLLPAPHVIVVTLRQSYPVLLGAGERLFGETSDKKSMRLLDTRTVGDGLAYLTYELVREA